MITVVGHNSTEVGVHLARLSGGLVDPPSGPLQLVAVHPSASSHAQHNIGHRFVSALTFNPTALGPSHGDLLRTATLFRGEFAKPKHGESAAKVTVRAAEAAIAGAVEVMPQLRDSNDRATAHHILRHYVLPALGLNQDAAKAVHLVPRRPELFHVVSDATSAEAAAQRIWDFYRAPSSAKHGARAHEAEEVLRALLPSGPCPTCRLVGRADAFAAPVCATCLHGVAVHHTTAPTPSLAGSDLMWWSKAAPKAEPAKPAAPSPYEDVIVAKEPTADALKPVLEKLQASTSRDVGGVRLPAKDVPDANAFATLCAHASKLEFLKKAHVYAQDGAAQRTAVVALTDSLGAGKSYATNYYSLADKFAIDLGDFRVARLLLTRMSSGDRKAPSDAIDVTIRQWKVDKAPHEANELEVTVSHKTPTTTQPDMSASQIATELMKLVGTPANDATTVRLNTGVSGPGKLSVGSTATGVKAASVPFDPAAGIKVTATAEPGAKFAQWRGDCSGSDPVCELKANQLDHDANVTAVFTPIVTVSALPAHLGDSLVEVQFQAPPKEFQPTKWDWVGWFKVGADDKGYLTWDWTHKQANGKLRLKAPTKAASGEYELRYYTYDKKKYTPVAKVPFMLRPASVQALLPELSGAARPDTLLTKSVPADNDMALRLKTRASGIVVRSQTTNMAGDDGVFQRIASAVTNLNFFPDDQASLTATALPVAVDSVFAVARPLVPSDKGATATPHVVTYYDVLETTLEEATDGKLFRLVATSRPDMLINAGLTVSVRLAKSSGKIDLFVEKRQEHGLLLRKYLSEAEHEETVERNVASLLHHLTVAGHNSAH